MAFDKKLYSSCFYKFLNLLITAMQIIFNFLSFRTIIAYIINWNAVSCFDQFYSPQRLKVSDTTTTLISVFFTGLSLSQLRMLIHSSFPKATAKVIKLFKLSPKEKILADYLADEPMQEAQSKRGTFESMLSPHQRKYFADFKALMEDEGTPVF